MIEILWHGRGGQGAFTAARILGAAYVLEKEGNYALAFPSFGPERRGAPIRAFTKLDNKPVADRCQIEKADFDIFLDETLFDETAFSELKPEGKILLNTKQRFDDERIITLDGDAIAAEILKLPITNTILLGSFAAVCDAVSLDAIGSAIRENMAPKLQEKNIAAVNKAFHDTRFQAGAIAQDEPHDRAFGSGLGVASPKQPASAGAGTFGYKDAKEVEA